MITRINDGYSNSKIPLRVVLHCTELMAPFDDNGYEMWNKFSKYTSSRVSNRAELR
jgi:hypothetical protein